MITQERLYTVADLWNLPSDKHYELIEGVLIEMSPTGGIHGEIALWLGALILNYVRENKLGRVFAAETGFVLAENPDTVRAPDIAFVTRERLPISPEKFLAIAPDLAVEVVSPGNSQDELHQKIVEYFVAGTRQVWIVFPRSRTIYVYRAPNEITVLSTKDTLMGADILPGFSVSLQTVFSVLDS